MSRLFINAIISSLAYTFMPGLIQAQEELSLPERKRFIDKIEIFSGVVSYYPNDHGWSEYVLKESDGRTKENVNSEIGYFIGIGLANSMNK